MAPKIDFTFDDGLRQRNEYVTNAGLFVICDDDEDTTFIKSYNILYCLQASVILLIIVTNDLKVIITQVRKIEKDGI